MTGRRKTVNLPKGPEQDEPEPVAPHLSPKPPAAESTLAGDQVGEYEMPDGSTFLLTADEAKQRGAKAIRPKNKAVNPSNK